MKLYEARRNSSVRLLEKPQVPPGAPELNIGEVIKFHHIDGMYSYCHAKDYTEPVHIAAWTEVEYT